MQPESVIGLLACFVVEVSKRVAAQKLAVLLNPPTITITTSRISHFTIPLHPDPMLTKTSRCGDDWRLV
jgi:hypothetical protein